VPETQIDINDVASIGVVRDSPPHEIPPEAWTLAENVRFEDDSVVQLLGYTQVFGTPLFAPYFAQFVSTPVNPWWLYAGLNKIASYDGTTHFDVTRTTDGATYNASGAAQWQGTNIGGLPILNNGTDVPQYWPFTTAGVFSGTTHMANLPNWPSTLRCRIIRAFGPLMLAMALTDSSGGPAVQKPYDVRWSHPADPGNVPPTWDPQDATHNAGQLSLSDVDSGQIMDGMGLQGKFYVYKENSVWRFRNVGGQYIFDEDPFLENIGLLTSRCVAVSGDGQKHFFVAQDNLYTHDGNSAKPLLDKRTRRYLFNNIDVGNYGNAFVFVNPVRKEGWFCYPQVGSTFPDRAIVINYDTGASTEVGGVDWQAAGIGTVQTSDTSTWATVAGTWAQQTTPWSFANRRKIVLCKPTATKIEELDLGQTRDGTTFTGLIQRTSLGVVGRKRTGEWIEDFEVRKMVHRIWPKMSGFPVQIRLGGQDVPNGPVRWSPYTAFDPNSQKYADITAEGAAISVEISGSNGWKLDGYKLDMVTLGRF
jgi:hypothetical protein